MKLLLRTFSNVEDYYGDCEWAFVELTKELAQTILKRAKAFKKAKEADDCLVEMYFWDSSPQYYEYSKLDEKLHDKLIDDEWMAAEETFKADDDAQSTECDSMVILDNYVYWTMYPKHTDVRITTGSVPLAEIEKAL